VGTGNNQFYPLYLSTGTFKNSLRRAHKDAMVLVGFLPIPKGAREHENEEDYRQFCRQLFHRVLTHVFASFKEHMKTPELVLFPDGFYRRVIYGFGAYLADYPEQVLLTGVKYGWCSR
jgi:hypothetical protein